MILSQEQLAYIADPQTLSELLSFWPWDNQASAPVWDEATVALFWAAAQARQFKAQGWLIQRDYEALTRVVEQGHVPPVAVQAWALATGKEEPLEAWRALMGDRLMPWGQLAGQPTIEKVDGSVTETPLHMLVRDNQEHGSHEDLIEKLLAQGADPNLRNSRDEPPLALALRLGLVETLVNAGADPWATVGSHSVMSAAWAGRNYGSACFSRWVAMMGHGGTPEQRTGILFDLARCGQEALLEVFMITWNVQAAELDALTATKSLSTNGPLREWSWTGWVASAALMGLYPAPAQWLAESTQRLGDQVAQLPPYDQTWLAVASEGLEVSPRALTSLGKWRDSIKPHLTAAGPWAVAHPDLPIDRIGGVTRSHPYRAWLAEQVKNALEAKTPEPGAWHWAARFMLEESEGNERMPTKHYKAVRQAVLNHAMKHAPTPDSTEVGVVLVALASSLEQASLTKNPSLPSLGAGGGMFIPGSFEPWITAPWDQEKWPEGTAAGLQSLIPRIQPNQITANFGRPAPSKKGATTWLGTWELFGSILRARTLDEKFQQVEEPATRRRLRL